MAIDRIEHTAVWAAVEHALYTHSPTISIPLSDWPDFLEAISHELEEREVQVKVQTFIAAGTERATLEWALSVVRTAPDANLAAATISARLAKLR